jgi:Tol biopolymer transport system component
VVAAGLALVVSPSARRLVGGLDAEAPQWSPSGDHLAFLVHDSLGVHVALYDFARRTHRVVGDTTPEADAEAFAWSPDGTQLAYAGPDVTGDGRDVIQVYDVATGAYRPLAAASWPHWRGDGSILAVCGPERPAFAEDLDDVHEHEAPGDPRTRFCRIDAETGEVSRTPLVAERGALLSPLLDRVIVERGTAEGTHWVVASVNTGETTRLPLPAGAVAPAWTPAGDRILFVTSARSGSDVWTMRDDGSDARRLLADAPIAEPRSVRLSGDGRLVFFAAPVAGDADAALRATGGPPVDLYVAPAGEGTPVRLTSRHPFKRRFAVSPDAKSIAYEILTGVKKPGGPGKREIWLMGRPERP